ncbi:hypothetical protein L6452_15288 [Arctium lappa]|uniref:Uncharacterized protein n=1 Tax=Arctium lappa TaxID=4217 RepID=A0ACB9CNE2_ARCLA|nr:hypothetical protein L6452_15288 [Arctium lappa]
MSNYRPYTSGHKSRGNIGFTSGANRGVLRSSVEERWQKCGEEPTKLGSKKPIGYDLSSNGRVEGYFGCRFESDRVKL